MDTGVLGTLFIALVVLQLTSLVAYHRGNRNLGMIYVFGPVAAVLTGVISLGLVVAADDGLFGAAIAILGIWLLFVWLMAVRRTWLRATGHGPDMGGTMALTDQDALIAETIVPMLAAVLGVESLIVWGVTLIS